MGRKDPWAEEKERGRKSQKRDMDDWLEKSAGSSAVSPPAASLPLQTVNVCACADDEVLRSGRGQWSEDNSSLHLAWASSCLNFARLQLRLTPLHARMQIHTLSFTHKLKGCQCMRPCVCCFHRTLTWPCIIVFGNNRAIRHKGGKNSLSGGRWRMSLKGSRKDINLQRESQRQKKQSV